MPFLEWKSLHFDSYFLDFCFWESNYHMVFDHMGAWYPSGSKPLPESQLTDLLSPYGVTRSKWVNVLYPMAHWGCFNSLAPGEFEWYLKYVIFKQILLIKCWGISNKTALIWMSLDFTVDQSTLVQVVAWCRQATSHYLSQCWPRSLSPCGFTMSQLVLT